MFNFGRRIISLLWLPSLLQLLVTAAAPAVTANQAQQQMAMVAALQPEIVVKLIALAQAADLNLTTA